MPDTTQTSVFHYEGDEGVEFVLRDILNTVGKSTESITGSIHPAESGSTSIDLFRDLPERGLKPAYM